MTQSIHYRETPFIPLGWSEKPPADDLYPKVEALIPRLRRYARALTRDLIAADDLVQEALSRALGKIHQWQEGTDLRAWLFTILHHLYVGQVRRTARGGARVELRDCDELLTLAPDQADRLALRDLERAIAELPEEQRSVILLVGVEGLSYEEVASMLHVPIGTVPSRVARGRETLCVRTELFPRRHPRRPSAAANRDYISHRAPDLAVSSAV